MDSGLISSCRSVFSPLSCVLWCFFRYRLLSIQSFMCFPGGSGAIITLLWFCCRYQEKMPWRRQHWNRLAWLEAMPLSGWEKQSLTSLFSLSTLMVNLFCFKHQKKHEEREKKEVTEKDAKLKHCSTQKLLHLPVYLKLLPRCALHSSRCWHWPVMCRLKELVCLFLFFLFFILSFSFEWNRQYKVKSLLVRAISYHFILPCSGSQALNSQPLQALLAFGGWVWGRGNFSVVSWPALCSIYRRQEWLEALLYNWLLFFFGRQFSSRGAGPCSLVDRKSVV